MTHIGFIDVDGRRVAVDAKVGETLMRAARAGGVKGILGDCGGGMSCLTCHCFVPPEVVGKIAPPSEQELELLECIMERRDTSRLACQIVVTPSLEGAVFELPEWQG